MIPVVIPCAAGAMFAAYHPAAGAAVLVCPPFGSEALITARLWRDLAIALAGRGVAVLRPDLPGTGDSAGDAHDPGRIAAWRAGLDACLAWLAMRHGGRVALLGHRLGALLALDAVARGAATERLVLLDPPASGKAVERGLRGRSRFEGYGTPPEGPGFIQAWGTPIADETLAGLAGIAPALPDCALPPTLFVFEETQRDASPWPARFRAAGAEVAITPFQGYQNVDRLFPLASAPPTGMLARIADFLADRAGSTGSVPVPADARPALLASTDWRESPLHFGRGGGLFGILCRPAQPEAGGPAVVLPSTAALPRSNFGRMWAILARRLAARGITSLRFDIAGVGESDGELGPDPLADTYRREREDDLRTAVDALQELGFPRAVAVAHCSGAYTALQAAGGDARLVGVCAGNPQFLNCQKVLTTAALLRPAGATPAPAPAAAAPPAESARPGLRHALRLRARRACPDVVRNVLRRFGEEERASRAHLRRVLKRGCALHIVFATEDFGYQRLLRAYGDARRLPPGLTVTGIEKADHGFHAGAHRATFLDDANAFVLRLAGTQRACAPFAMALLETAA